MKFWELLYNGPEKNWLNVERLGLRLRIKVRLAPLLVSSDT